MFIPKTLKYVKNVRRIKIVFYIYDWL